MRMTEKKQEKKPEGKKEKIVRPIFTRGRIFEGFVIKKFPTRVVIEFERTLYIPKYERYFKKKTRLHAKLPNDLNVDLGDYIKIQECRPISKIIHFLVLEVVRKASESKENIKLEDTK